MTAELFVVLESNLEVVVGLHSTKKLIGRTGCMVAHQELRHATDEEICPYQVQNILRQTFIEESKAHPVVFCRNGLIIERQPTGEERVIREL